MQLENIKGLGSKTLLNLNELGINNIDDLVRYYPYRFNIIKKTDLSTNVDNNKVVLSCKVCSEPTLFYYGKNQNKMDFRVLHEQKVINVVIFNRGFLKNKIKPDSVITVIGKYENGSIVASDIRMFDIKDKEIIEPIYRASGKLSSVRINKLIINALSSTYEINDILPIEIINKYKLRKRSMVIKEIHSPSNLKNLNSAINHLKYEEFFVFLEKINKMKIYNQSKKGIKRDIEVSKYHELISNIPFELTEDQKKAVDEIKSDLCDFKIMNRLLQGDVGSGKTIVAFISLYINYLSGYQGALMVPTDVLARQHYNNIKELLKDYDIPIFLLTGNIKSTSKNEIKEKIKNGDNCIIIGTHALISKDVIYNKLGLVIIDEQHRFGVNQRAALRKKGENVDVLTMSATPIPRSYALTIYGDMDITNIKSKPISRKPVLSFLKKESEIKDVLSKVYEQIKENNQVYVVVPLVEDSDNSDMSDVNDIKTKFNKAFSNKLNIQIIHGKMASKEKESVMNDFYDKKINILISTTVIEVGLDSKDATVMIVFNSERFGLSTLHQLRGRVGRGIKQSFFYMISNKKAERLEVLRKTNDGFKISEYDFEERGSGEFFGTKQSGINEFKVADIRRDFKLLKQVEEDVKKYLKT